MRSHIPVLCASLSLLAASALAAVEPVDPADFLVDAGQPAQLRLKAAPGATVAWRLADWGGREEATGSIVAGADGVAAVMLTPVVGWHELTVAGAPGSLGLLARDPALERAEPDPFFCVDAALSWLVKDEAMREHLIGQLRRLGIDQVRERVGWYSVQTAGDRFVWDNRFQDDRLRQTYARHGIATVECFQDAPVWLGQVAGIFPLDLAATARSWGMIVSRWSAVGAVEVWNEPDAAEFAGDGTPDQLAVTTRAVAWGVRQARPEVLTLGGVFTSASTEDYRRRCFANGLLAASDVLTYHDYRDADKMQPWLAQLRRELAEAGDPSIPIWITEAGKAWPIGTPRAKAGDDMRSALAIAVRAAEARACGIQRYFAFVLPFYPEARSNFGLTGQDGTAQRNLAAYSHVARRLAGLDYAGDLELPGTRSARFFLGGRRAVAVVWLGAPSADARLATDLPVQAAYGLDGRTLAHDANGWVVPDGACLLDLKPDALAQVLAQVKTDTPAMPLWQVARRPRPRPAMASVLMRLLTEPGVVSSCHDDYRLAPVAGGTPLRLQVTNLGAAPATASVRLVPPAGVALTDGVERSIELAAGAAGEVMWKVPSASGDWRVEGRLADGTGLVPISILVRAEPDGEALLARLPTDRRRTLTLAEQADADQNIGIGNRITTERVGDELLRWRFDFLVGGDHWAFPRTSLPADARFDRFDAVLIKARALQPGAVRFFAFEQGGPTGNIGWYAKQPAFASDGAWHWTLIRLADLVHCPATDADPNGQLDRMGIDRISLGMTSMRRNNGIEVARMELLRLEGLDPPP